MMICKGDGLLRDVSLVDDTSTVHNASDGETTSFATTITMTDGQGSIRHEGDMMTLVSDNQAMSEHSRLLTDDDGPETMWGQNRYIQQHLQQQKLQQQHQQQQRERPKLQHQPLDSDQDRSLQPASSWSRTLDGFVTVSNSNLNSSFSNSMSSGRRFIHAGFGGGASTPMSDQSDGGGYAFEMLGESDKICRNAGDAIHHAVAQMFKCGDGVGESNQYGQQQQKEVVMDGVDDDLGILGTIQGVFGAMNDHVDYVLIRVFNVPASEVQVSPSYTMYSVNDSTMTDSLALGGGSERKQRATREIDVVTPTAGVASPVTKDVGNNQQQFAFADESSEMKSHHSLQYSYSDAVKDDGRDGVIGSRSTTKEAATSAPSMTVVKTNSDVSSTESDDSVRRFKEDLYRGLGIEIPRIGSMDEPQRIVSGRSKSKDKPAESRDDDGGHMKFLEHIQRPTMKNVLGQRSMEVLNGVVSLTACNGGIGATDSAAEKEKTGIDEDDKRTDTPDHSEVWNSFSELHKTRVLQLLNKNLPATNLSGISGVIDVSHLDVEVNPREFVPVGKTGLADTTRSDRINGTGTIPTDSEEAANETTDRSTVMKVVSPRDEFHAMMKRLPKSPSYRESTYFVSQQDEPEAIDLTMYEEPL
jgi:hypothetical protein